MVFVLVNLTELNDKKVKQLKLDCDVNTKSDAINIMIERLTTEQLKQ